MRGAKTLVAMLLVTVLGVPYLLRPARRGGGIDAARLIILSPHHEEIRYEFGAGFSEWHERRYGRPVEVDWRNVGNTGQVSRYVASEFQSAFERFYRRQHGRAIPLSDWVRPESYHDAHRRELARQIREELLDPRHAAEIMIGVDLVFGGGAYEHEQFRRLGYSVPCPVDRQILKGIPQRWAGIDYYYIEEQPGEHRRSAGFDPTQDWRPGADGYWYGTALSGFGIVYNRRVLHHLGLPEPVHWSDLAGPRYFGWLGLADPRSSGSATTGFEMILQTQIADRLRNQGSGSGGVARPERSDGRGIDHALSGRATLPLHSSEALEKGWRDGLNLIKRIAANARFFTESSTRVPLDVSSRNAAAGMSIDFYGRFQAEYVGGDEVGYVNPPGGTAITPDPVCLLRGAPNRTVAVRFVEYVLSLDGQMLWDLPAGFQDLQTRRRGPLRYTPRRMSIRPKTYRLYRPHLKDQENPFDDSAVLLDYRPEYTARLFNLLRMLIGAMCIDTHDELREAWVGLHQAPSPAAIEQFDRLPLTHAQAMYLAGASDEQILRMHPSWSAPSPDWWPRGALNDPQLRLEITLDWLKAFRRQYREVVDITPQKR